MAQEEVQRRDSFLDIKIKLHEKEQRLCKIRDQS